MASKWRPNNEQCLYVFPDVHGNYHCLEILLNKILPLRNKHNDKIIFLGDYIDRSIKTKHTLDLIINLKKLYPNNVITLKGNHEDLMLTALGQIKENEIYEKNLTKIWLMNGGAETVVSYTGSHIFSQRKMLESLPVEHLEFLKSCVNYYELDNYIFVHGGCDPSKPLNMQTPSGLQWDRDLYKLALKCRQQKINVPWDKMIICGHSGPDPLLYDNFAMLDVGSPKRLICFEANSRKAILSEQNSINATTFKFE